MAMLPDLIRDYCEILEQQSRLNVRKENLRRQILAELTRLNVPEARYSHGHAQRTTRFTLVPRPQPVLNLLDSEDLLPFAHFTPPKVKQLLVPKYGRERLLPLFDVEKRDLLIVRRPKERSRDSGADFE